MKFFALLLTLVVPFFATQTALSITTLAVGDEAPQLSNIRFEGLNVRDGIYISRQDYGSRVQDPARGRHRWWGADQEGSPQDDLRQRTDFPHPRAGLHGHPEREGKHHRGALEDP